MKPRACHTSMKTGARAIAILRDGKRIVGRFVEKKGRFVVLDSARIPTSQLRSLGYFKEADNG